MEKKDRIFTRKDVRKLRKELRNNATEAEKRLWYLLKNKSLDSIKFRRQHSIGPYIMDFYCPSLKLCIELDGYGHETFEALQHDKKRTFFINYAGISVLRFSNLILYKSPDAIINSILNFAKFPHIRKGLIKDTYIE